MEFDEKVIPNSQPAFEKETDQILRARPAIYLNRPRNATGGAPKETDLKLLTLRLWPEQVKNPLRRRSPNAVEGISVGVRREGRARGERMFDTRRLATGLTFHDLIVGAISKECLKHSNIHLVAAAEGAVAADDGRAR